MTERTIFLNALDVEDATARIAYLGAVCAGQPALRHRIEKLLRTYREAGTFLNVPVMEQLAGDDQVLTFLEPSRQSGTLGRLDHYEVKEVLGRGGTGMVFKAWDTRHQRVVAIKVLAPRLAASGTARKRFVRQARAVAAVRDDHIVGTHGVNGDGPLPYLVMEYIAGTTLEDRIKQGGALSIGEILRIGHQVARGLGTAHAHGLIHRDIKPGNILLEDGSGRIKIADFGLARAAGGPAEPGVIAGTPLFMSPEQARGEPTDHRTDLFSLGSVLYTLCTGRPPFRGDSTLAVLKCVCEQTPRPIREIRPDVPGWLCDIISKLHAREAHDRFASAEEVADLLQQPLPAAPAAGCGMVS
jgi:serine/threonine protein kinase